MVMRKFQGSGRRHDSFDFLLAGSEELLRSPATVLAVSLNEHGPKRINGR